ncbi:hypothetical protein NCLIV_024340 [Neospora caninum Liverpool]|uniref:RRM domain-containing protein n=1 Tax=Neospora caninum (strain Liverpool) TaxID=572307 RepID=F0VG02_NEOCL|nr:hypothetical protein NCLIV_024340 [Neospora caninum Liverpool]CBZ52646.1 hypothetical protein NCLIV_024340 [Neospora caninum Liverpool]|eukprot:XP_003882678.1 hypothetical protein NCLIV_024340 [Neospora caninum Liverpool]
MEIIPAADPSRVNAPANANIQAVWKLNELELKHNLTGEASWHWTYRNSSYIFIGGLDVRLTEGDIIIVFSQWGEPVDIHLVRDRKTGVPKGFCFLAYEDQRSTILAVDNANGMKLLNSTLRVDHCKNYRPPRKDEDDDGGEYEATGAEGAGIGVYRVTEDEKKKEAALSQAARLQKETEALQTKIAGRHGKDVDEMWAEEFEEMLKQVNEDAEEEAKQVLRAERRRQKEEKRRLKAERKREKKEMKRIKKMKRRRLEETVDGDESDTTVPTATALFTRD